MVLAARKECSGRDGPAAAPGHPGHRALEATRHFAEKLDLSTASPDSSICSSGDCLSGANEYLFYQPASNENLSIDPEPGHYRYEWFNTETNRIVDTGEMVVQGQTELRPPTLERYVLHLSRQSDSYQAQREAE